MRSTIFFISMLLFVSASKDLFDTQVETQLLELSKDPSSEAVFATMSMQLETEGGFDRVLGLLNTLVNDGKKQLHQMTRTWRRVSARCQVSAEMFETRQEFFDHAFTHGQRRVSNAQRRLSESKDNLAANGKSVTVFTNVLNNAIARHNNQAKIAQRSADVVNGAVDALTNAFKEVQNWTPRGAALIQSSMKAIATGFAEVNGYSLNLPTEFLETAGSDHKVRKRLLEWFGMLKKKVLGWRQSRQESDKRFMAAAKEQQTTLAALISALKAHSNNLTKTIERSNQSIKNNSRVVELYGKLRVENAALMASEKKYCGVEKDNFTRNESRTKAAIALFKEIRTYFIDHYKAVHSYIRAHFNERK